MVESGGAFFSQLAMFLNRNALFFSGETPMRAKVFAARMLDSLVRLFYFNMRANGVLNSLADVLIPLLTSHVVRSFAFHLPQLLVLW